jgi:hypothetical protein
MVMFMAHSDIESFQIGGGGMIRQELEKGLAADAGTIAKKKMTEATPGTYGE